MQKSRKLEFYKYQGTGNDFILIDNRQDVMGKSDAKLIEFLCDRRFGIGADGLILLEDDESTDFRMVYFNSDGNQSSMCGNGGRCIVAFAKKMGIIEDKTMFTAIDGLHQAEIQDGIVSLTMKDVSEIRNKPNYHFLNTGSPHHVQLVDELDAYDVREEGQRLRYGLYGQKGSNINFAEQLNEDEFKIRTYERGVEDETLSCGTGVTAAAIAMHHAQKTQKQEIKISTLGGSLSVCFDFIDDSYTNVRLIGPAKFIYKGEIAC